jgi:hypothetical protein
MIRLGLHPRLSRHFTNHRPTRAHLRRTRLKLSRLGATTLVWALARVPCGWTQLGDKKNL